MIATRPFLFSSAIVLVDSGKIPSVQARRTGAQNFNPGLDLVTAEVIEIWIKPFHIFQVSKVP